MKMIKTLVVLSTLAVASCQQFELINNLVDLEDAPYQRISLPYPYQDNVQRGAFKIRRQPLNSAIMTNKGFNVLELPAKLKETHQVKSGLSSVNKSLISTLYSVATKFAALAKSALNLLAVNTPAIIFGAVLVIMFCKITSICTKLHSIKTISEIKKEFNTYVTPEKLDMVTEFIKGAVRKYQSMQKK